MFSSLGSSIGGSIGSIGSRVSGLLGDDSKADSVVARKHRIQDGLRRAQTASAEYDKEGIINMEAGENEVFSIPPGSVESVVSALYGSVSEPDATIDVLSRIQKDIEEGTEIKVNNTVMGGDPKPGKRKVLRVKYKPVRTTITVSAEEGKDIRLPEHAAEGVVSAMYGEGSDQKDVTMELLQSLLNAPGKPVPVNNDLFGDPAPGVLKKLRVCYDPSRTRQQFKLQTPKELATFGLVSPWLFRDVCGATGTSLDEFFASMTDQELTGGEKQVSGKSGEIFWFTANNRFVLKTISESETGTLVRMLPNYITYLAANPKSLLARYLGVFSLEDNGTTTQFVVMNNVFEGAPPLDVLYDLKGTTEDRWVDPEPGRCLKDNNFAETTLYFDDEKAAQIHAAVVSDTRYLEKQGIMDYSMMVGISRKEGPLSRVCRYSTIMGGLEGVEATGVTGDASRKCVVYLGMVDMLVTYGWKKVAAHTIKTAVYVGEEIDTVNPVQYASRYRQYFARKIRGNSEKVVVTAVPAESFKTPMPALGRSGGTAAFFAATFRESAADPEAKQSNNYWIGKDLARAKDEVAFYEAAMLLKDKPGFELLKWMTPYKGVVRCPCEAKAGEPPKPVDVMLLRNGRDGYQACRMLDIKIGQVTAVAGWQGKSSFSAWMQTNTIDAVTNSAGQGFRLEGFDNPPDTLRSFEDLLSETKSVSGIAGESKVKRFNLQRMTAGQFMSLFLDLHETSSSSYAKKHKKWKAPEPSPQPDPNLLSVVETQELVLLNCIEELAELVSACRTAEVPQQWIGSSVMLCFDSGKRPSRDVLRRGPGAWNCARVHIFDWGRSELNTAKLYARLENAEKDDRQKYWGYYRGAVAKLLYDCCKVYMARFWRGKRCLTCTVWDKDVLTPDDFIGVSTVPLVAATDSKQSLRTFAGGVVKSGMLRGTEGSVHISAQPLNFPRDSRLCEGWSVNVRSAANLPSKDALSANDTFVEVMAWPEDATTAMNSLDQPEVQRMIREGAHVSSLALNVEAPVWEEEFELATLSEGAKQTFLNALWKAFGTGDTHSLKGTVETLFPSNLENAVFDEKAKQLRAEFIVNCFPDLDFASVAATTSSTVIR